MGTLTQWKVSARLRCTYPSSPPSRASVCETVNEFYALLVPFKDPAEPQREEEIVAMQG